MQNVNNDHKRAAKLLDLLSDEATDPATKEEIRAWLWSDVSSEAKETALLEQFRQLVPNPAPDKSDRKSYTELATRLNLNAPMPVRKKRRTLPGIFVRIAAAVVLLLGLSGTAYLWIGRDKNSGQQPQSAQITETAGASPRSIRLPDGSSVELQANSVLEYDEHFISDRRIYLDGEALLTVAKSTNDAGEPVPFSVTTDDLRVDALGTVFRVIDPSDDRDDRSIVALYDGSVDVAANDGLVTLQRGEAYHYTPSTRQSNVVLLLAREMIQHGFTPLLRFEESTLGNLVASLAANHGVEFVLPEDVDLSRGRFSGDFQAENLQSTLNILTQSNRTHSFELTKNQVVVKRK